MPVFHHYLIQILLWSLFGLYFLSGLSSANENKNATANEVHLLLIKDEGSLASILEERFSSYPIRVVIAASRPESMKQGDLLVEGMISYQPMCQGYESPFGKFGIPSRYQSKSMEANLKVSGDLKDGVQVKEHWIFDSQATGEVVSKAELAEELIQSITREILKLLLNEPSRLNP